MNALPELQKDFSAAVFGGDARADDALARHCAGPAARVREGIAAYRRSVLSNLAGAVRATYPVVTALVGEEFMTAASHRYAREIPSRQGDLNAYGEDFDRFLAPLAEEAGLPYLPDVARLEWLVQAVYTAPDAPPGDLSRLAATAPGDWEGLRFRLDPAHALFVSPWPVARLWEVHQPDYAGDFTVAPGAQAVLVQRREAGIAVEALADAEHAWLHALADGARLAEAVEAAMEASVATADDGHGFDLAEALRKHIATGLLRQAF